MKNLVIIYIPVINQAYLEFLRPYQKTHSVFLVDEEFSKTLPTFSIYRERDLRKIEVGIVKDVLEKLGYDVFTCKDLPEISIDNFINCHYEITMPDEDVSDEIVNIYIDEEKDDKIQIIKGRWLRWDRKSTTKAFQLDTGIEQIKDRGAIGYMSSAYHASLRAQDWWRQVGSVVITKDGLEFSAYNHHMPKDQSINEDGDPRSNFNAGEHIELSTAIHSEASLIANAAKKSEVSLDGAKLYVTTFPCPVCARLIVESGISEVYFEEGYSLLDAKDILQGAGVKLFRVSTKED